MKHWVCAVILRYKNRKSVQPLLRYRIRKLKTMKCCDPKSVISYSKSVGLSEYLWRTPLRRPSVLLHQLDRTRGAVRPRRGLPSRSRDSSHRWYFACHGRLQDKQFCESPFSKKTKKVGSRNMLLPMLKGLF